MFQHDRLNNELTFWQKIKELDYILLTSVFLLSILSLFVMFIWLLKSTLLNIYIVILYILMRRLIFVNGVHRKIV